MITTRFKPSIHGWPFGNSYDLKVKVAFMGKTLENLGYCGGMCWSALENFYSATPIKRDLTLPTQGEPLYDEILGAQLASLSPGKLWQIYSWQQSPQLSHRFNPHHSQGYLTQQQWPTVRSRLDASKPVTLTLIAHSNDYDVRDLEDNHRVVAYAYEVRSLNSSDWVHGERRAGIKHVTLYIYDPNYPNKDDVALTFFTGCEDSWIGMEHSKGKDFRAFFLDDSERQYRYGGDTTLWINGCKLFDITGYDETEVDLTFTWSCRFIPYFRVLLNGATWGRNQAARERYAPTTGDDKQCPSRSGTMTVRLKVPRDQSSVGVRLLDQPDYERAIAVDMRPLVSCRPYVHTRFGTNAPQVYDTALEAADLFIKDGAPTDAALQAADVSPDHWVYSEKTIVRWVEDGGGRWIFTPNDQYSLGNIAVPILANFVETNLAKPTVLSGVLKVTRAGQTAPTTTNVPNLNPTGQQIWEGFKNNPGDYDGDTKVEFKFTSKDKFGKQTSGTATFYGRSIIDIREVIAVSLPEAMRIDKLKDVTRELVERRLAEAAVGLPQAPDASSPVPGRFDISLWNRLRRDTRLTGAIDSGLQNVWNDRASWETVKQLQEEIQRRLAQDRAIRPEASGNIGEARKAREAEQEEYESIIIDVFSQAGLDKLSQDTVISRRLKVLARPTATPVAPK
jgi:hypothetical protein